MFHREKIHLGRGNVVGEDRKDTIADSEMSNDGPESQAFNCSLCNPRTEGTG